MLDLGGADAVGQRAEGAVRRGVAVAADDGRARQREALLGADDVDDALALVELVVILRCRNRLAFLASVSTWMRLSSSAMPLASGRWSARCDRPRPASSPARAPCGRSCAGLRRPAGSSPRGRDGGRYRAGRCRLGLVDQMVVPDLVVERARLGHRFMPSEKVDFGAYLASSGPKSNPGAGQQPSQRDPSPCGRGRGGGDV